MPSYTSKGFAANGTGGPASYGSSSASAGYGSYSDGGGMNNNPNGSGASSGADGGIRRRQTHLNGGGGYNNHHYNGDYYGGDDGGGSSKGKKSSTVEKLDFMFPKVAQEFTVKTHGGGVATIAAYCLVLVLALTEITTWMGQNRLQNSQTVVDTSLGKKMRVNMNITFPALACEDLHLDAIDVAGDSQLNVDEGTLKKKRLHINGKVYSNQELEVELNKHTEDQKRKERILKAKLPKTYCGPCYGAHEHEMECCDTCDEIIAAYKKKKWKTDLLQYTAEQCVREGRDKKAPKLMAKGQGCNLSGYMTVNRVSGNFHIAMGEGVERDGRHIHTYNPDDAMNFNASHIIHSMSFGPEDGNEPLNGATKIVTIETGATGLFQYFIKVVPTVYVGDESTFPILAEESLPSLYPEVEESVGASAGFKRKRVETNRYFFTERFMPLMTELLEDEQVEEDEHGKKAVADTGYTGGHHNKKHLYKENAVLPGVFFIYEIYPFAMEITQNEVPLTHLIIRLMATIGGVFTLAGWFDSFVNNGGGGSGEGSRRAGTRFSTTT